MVLTGAVVFIVIIESTEWHIVVDEVGIPYCKGITGVTTSRASTKMQCILS